MRIEFQELDCSELALQVMFTMGASKLISDLETSVTNETSKKISDLKLRTESILDKYKRLNLKAFDDKRAGKSMLILQTLIKYCSFSTDMSLLNLNCR